MSSRKMLHDSTGYAFTFKDGTVLAKRYDDTKPPLTKISLCQLASAWLGFCISPSSLVTY